MTALEEEIKEAARELIRLSDERWGNLGRDSNWDQIVGYLVREFDELCPPDADPIRARYKQKAKISAGLRREVYERDAYRCVTCGGHTDLSLDHIIPESKGGPTTSENLQTMCRPCNSAKGVTMPGHAGTS